MTPDSDPEPQPTRIDLILLILFLISIFFCGLLAGGLIAYQALH